MSDTTTVSENKGPNGVAAAKAYRQRAAAPFVDVFENPDELLIVADVPGVPNDGIDLSVENDTLTLVARRSARVGADAPALVREYAEVDFTTTFRIPAGIDTAGITAETKHGTLVIRLPKSAAAKSRRIVVRPRSGD
jgi:HSP20 family protein